MLHVLLLILKIIGITLLVILGLIILIILLLLFVPVRYSGDGRFKRLDETGDDADDTGGKTVGSEDNAGETTGNFEEYADDTAEKKSFDLYALAKVTWLLHFISLSFNYSEDFGYRLKVLGISVMRGGNQSKDSGGAASGTSGAVEESDDLEETDMIEEGKAESGKSEEGKAEPEKPEESKKESEKTEDSKPESERSEENKTEPGKQEEVKTESEKTENIKPEDHQDSTAEPEKEKKEKLKDKHKKKGGKKDAKQKSDSAETGSERSEKQSVVEKIKNIYNNFISLRDDKKVQRAYETVKGMLVKLLNAVCPRKLGGYAAYGFEDPAITGYITAFLAAEYGHVRNLDIDPHFEDQILEGNLKFKGRIFLITIVSIGLKFLLNKDIKYARKKIEEFQEAIKSEEHGGNDGGE